MRRAVWGLMGGMTAVWLGYFMVWLPGPAAGLQFMGIEMGEWTKFLGMGPERNRFYLPPITLGLMLVLASATWPNRRRRTWGMRGLGVAVSLLAFPAVADLLGPARDEYLIRVVWIGMVGLAAVLSGLGGRLRPSRRWLVWLLLGVTGVVGLALPTGAYLAVRTAVEPVLGRPVGIGPGVWLNGLGHLGVTAVSAFLLLDRWRHNQNEQEDAN